MSQTADGMQEKLKESEEKVTDAHDTIKFLEEQLQKKDDEKNQIKATVKELKDEFSTNESLMRE